MSKYLPRGLKLLDPRAMRQEDIVKFFKHISTRQISHGVRDAFRFKAVMTSRKGSNLDKTHYIDPLANPALLVMDPLDTEPNPASPSGHVPALPSVYSDLNPAPTYEPVPALPPLILLEQREDDQNMHLIMPVMTIRKQQNGDLDRNLDQQREEERRSRDTLLKMPVTFVKLYDRNVRHLPLTQDTNGS